MDDILNVIKTFGLQIKWWDHPSGWSVTDMDDERLESGLSDDELSDWCTDYLIEHST